MAPRITKHKQGKPKVTTSAHMLAGLEHSWGHGYSGRSRLWVQDRRGGEEGRNGGLFWGLCNCLLRASCSRLVAPAYCASSLFGRFEDVALWRQKDEVFCAAT